ncbi:MAG: hypothetical protein UIB61_01455 [Treponema sp.]|nr:hypothetical protein [Treponema sp.]
MIKTMTKFIAGFAAAASLLLAAGCTNQLDYVNDNTALNKMQIVGFKVSGLDAAYDGATAQLMVSEGESEVAIGKTTIAAVGTEKSQDSGTAFVKFDEPYIFDGDTLHTSKISMYLQVGTKSFKVADPANGKLDYAKLAVKTSPAGTADKDLVKNYVNIAVYNDVPEYSFVASAVETFAIPVYMCSFDISTAASEADLPDGVEIKLADKTGTNNKYTVTFKGLTDNVGTKFVVAGSAISSKDEVLGDNWNIMETAGIKVTAVVTDNGLIKEVDKDGNITFVFYGTKPSWASNKSPAIKIAAYNVDTDPWTCLLSNDNGNWFFPDYTDGHDVTMTVDLAKLSTDNWKKSDAKYEGYKIYVDGIHIINAPVEKEHSKIFLCSGDGDIAWHNWIPENAWGTGSHSYTSADLKDGGYGWGFDTPVEIKPASETFNLGIQITKPNAKYIKEEAYKKLKAETDSSKWDDKCFEKAEITQDNKKITIYYQLEKANDGTYNYIVDSDDFWSTEIGGGALYTSTLQTSEYMDKHYVFVVNVKADDKAVVSLVPATYSSISDCFVYSFEKLILKDFDDDNVELIGPFNNWADSGTIKGTKSGSDITFDLTGKDLSAGFKIRSVGNWNGNVNIGPTMGNIEFPIPPKSGTFNCEITVNGKKGEPASVKAVSADN